MNINCPDTVFVQSFVKPSTTFHIDSYDLEEITKRIYGNSIEINNDNSFEHSPT